MKLVLDTDVLVAALRSPTGASAELIRLARNGAFKPVISVALVLEYEAICTLPEHLLASGLMRVEALSIIDMLIDKGEWTRINYLYKPLTRDPGDEMVIEAALNSGADAMVTFNIKDYGTAPATFNLGCWLPSEALRRVRHG
jgi:putative PIN family toxin of toxin-antitoxin system